MTTDAEIIARKLALFIIAGYLPNDYAPPKSLDDPRWTAMIGTRYADGKLYWEKVNGRPNGDQVPAWEKGTTGTTCGYLTQWMLWALGCRDWATVNREDDAWNTSLYDEGRGDESIHWIVRIGTAKLWFDYRKNFPAGSGERKLKKSPIWTTPSPGALPGIGDVVYIHTPPFGTTHHVFVFLGLASDGKRWLTAEAGQDSKVLSVNGKYKSCASHFKLRTPTFGSGKRSSTLVGFADEPVRTIQGWLSLEGLLTQRPERWVNAEFPTLSDGVFDGATVSQLPKPSETTEWGSDVLAELAWRLVYELLDTIYMSAQAYDHLYMQIPDTVWNLAVDLWMGMGSPSLWTMGFPSIGGAQCQEHEALRVAASVEANSRIVARQEGRRPEPSPTLNSGELRAYLAGLKAELARRAASWLELGAAETGAATLDLHLDGVDES